MTHHLDDCIEKYKETEHKEVIPLIAGNIIRPFLTTPKEAFIRANIHNLSWYDDRYGVQRTNRKNTRLGTVNKNKDLGNLVRKLIENQR